MEHGKAGDTRRAWEEDGVLVLWQRQPPLLEQANMGWEQAEPG